MWGKNLEERLRNVSETNNLNSDLKYLPPDEVDNLRLRELGCDADAILFREEYHLTSKRLEDLRPNVGGVVVTGQPGIGMCLS